MNLLLDTNIFLEILLNQERAAEARQLLSKAEEHHLYISDFALHSIGLSLFRCNQHKIYQQFITDLLSDTGIMVLSLTIAELKTLIPLAREFSLDFDDAYQRSRGCLYAYFG